MTCYEANTESYKGVLRRIVTDVSRDGVKGSTKHRGDNRPRSPDDHRHDDEQSTDSPCVLFEPLDHLELLPMRYAAYAMQPTSAMLLTEYHQTKYSGLANIAAFPFSAKP